MARERPGPWRRNFKGPQAQLRWLGTLVLVASYFWRRDHAALTVTAAMLMHITVSWCYCVIANFVQAQSEFTTFDELEHFIRHLPEFKIWCSTTKTVIAALGATFLPKDVMALLALFYLVGVCAWIASFVSVH